jgi:flagellar biosynthetic protein FlhB
MADDRTEPPTYKRRTKAREEGQVARSAELVGSTMLFALLWSLPGLAPRLTDRLADFWARTMAAASQGGIGTNTLGELAGNGLVQVGMLSGPVLGLVAAGALLSNLAQVGLHFNAGLLQPKLSRLNTVRGLTRLVTLRSGVELLKGLVKLSIVGYTGWLFYQTHWNSLFELGLTDPMQIAPRVGELAHQMALRMVATLAVLAALDYAYQRWQLERSLRMTKQEIIDEMKEAEGNPEIKARIRQRQREISRRRMMAEVPTASVVITNPTHFAVALKYEMGTGAERRQGAAPRLVAKGQDLLALRIRDLAEQHRVPTVEDAPLARSIYKLVDIGEEIPPELYRAVAEVLALIWRVDGARRPATDARAAFRRPA